MADTTTEITDGSLVETITPTVQDLPPPTVNVYSASLVAKSLADNDQQRSQLDTDKQAYEDTYAENVDALNQEKQVWLDRKQKLENAGINVLDAS